MDMINWLNSLMTDSRAFPVVSYPAMRFLQCNSIKQLLQNAELQAECILKIAQMLPVAAACMPMDLSVEAECFGAKVRFSDTEVPAVEGAVLDDITKASEIKIPPANSGRAGLCARAVSLAAAKLKTQAPDKPLFAGIIGPFSLAGRLADITEIMYYCYDEPNSVKLLLSECTEFIINYAMLMKKSGANGILLCEPLAGMLSPSLEVEFSAPFVKEITSAVQSSDFIVIYHNCGNSVASMVNSLAQNGAAAYHFGNSVKLSDILALMPANKAVMGNINPVGVILNGSVQSVKAAVSELRKDCSGYDNFVLSTGCDIPPGTPWENIEALFCE